MVGDNYDACCTDTEYNRGHGLVSGDRRSENSHARGPDAYARSDGRALPRAARSPQRPPPMPRPRAGLRALPRPMRTGLCRILDTNFGESPFPDVGCIRARKRAEAVTPRPNPTAALLLTIRTRPAREDPKAY